MYRLSTLLVILSMLVLWEQMPVSAQQHKTRSLNTCTPGTKYIIRCNLCQCDSRARPGDCKVTTCPDYPYAWYYNIKTLEDNQIPACKPNGSFLDCQECFCASVNNPIACIRTTCPAAKSG